MLSILTLAAIAALFLAYLIQAAYARRASEYLARLFQAFLTLCVLALYLASIA